MQSTITAGDEWPAGRELTETEVGVIEVTEFMATLGKSVLHLGGKPSTDRLYELARFDPGHRVLEVGCGAGTTAIDIATRFGCEVTAIDVAPAFVERARANVRDAELEDRVAVRQGDVLSLELPDDSFDRVVAEAVLMYVDRDRAVRELARVCRPGGTVLDHEGYLREETPPEVREVAERFVPGLAVETAAAWVDAYEAAGLTGIEVETGPAQFFGPRNVIRDEGLVGFLGILGRLLTDPGALRRMAALAPRIRRVEPYVESVVLAAHNPA